MAKAGNVVLVGAKPVMTYVVAVLEVLHSGSTEVVVRARGQAISKAVDAAEIVRNRFVRSAEVKEVRIGTESVKREGGGSTKVSYITITLHADIKSMPPEAVGAAVTSAASGEAAPPPAQ